MPTLFSPLTAAKEWLRQRRVPRDFPYYANWLNTNTQKHNGREFRRQILQMQGLDPESSDADFDRLMQDHPEFETHPLSAYIHRYDNGNPLAGSTDKKIIFLHLQRTAGTTFTHFLRRNVRSIAFRRDFVGMPTENPIFILNRFRELAPAEQEQERNKWDTYDAFADHSIYGIHELLHSPYEYVTILRHPIERFLSYYRFVQQEKPGASPYEQEESHLARQLSISEFICHPFFRLKLNLEQSYVQMLAGYLHPGGYVFESRMPGLLSAAKRHLADFGAVLLQEHFDESIALMCARYDWRDELLTGDGIIPREKTVIGDTMHAANSATSLSHEERRVLSHFLRWDIELYEYGKRIFHEQLNAQGLQQPHSHPVPATQQNILNNVARHTYEDIEAYQTSIGPISIRLTWATLARQRGLDPLAIDTAARHAYYTLNLRGDALLQQTAKAFPEHEDLFRLWLLTLHGQNVCNKVIEEDFYGLRALQSKGFSPDVIVDVGAHIGAFSIFAHHLWPHAKIIAVEACSPDMLRSGDISILEKNLENIPQASIHRIGLFGLLEKEYNAACRAELKKDTAGHWMEMGVRAHHQFAGDVMTWNIHAESIVNFLRRQGIDHIGMLKLCCDGAEANIVRELAMNDMLKHIDEIRGEWHGDMGKNILPDVLGSTHHVHMHSIPPAHVRGSFSAGIRREPISKKGSCLSPQRRVFHTQAEHAPRCAEPVQMLAYTTSMGALYMQGQWEMELLPHGINPDMFHAQMMLWYYRDKLRGDDLSRSMSTFYGISPDIAHQWLEYLHSQHICTHVIDDDCYGIEEMKDNGFEPRTIVDIGGHIGTFTLRAHTLWPEAHIVTAEPANPGRTNCHFEFLEANTRNNPRVTISNKAIIGFWDKPGREDRLRELQTEQYHHQLEKELLGGSPRDTAEFAQVQALNTETFLRDHSISTIDLLKIDCEGAEVNIIRELDALGMLGHIRAIRGEWHGKRAAEVLPDILAKTHDCTFASPDAHHGLFCATLK